jgi:hypothetical protein
MTIRERVQSGDEVRIGFAFLREILGDWRDRAAEFQEKIDRFAADFELFGMWDWEHGTHVTFRRARG